MLDRLFVYGTLRKNIRRSMFHMLGWETHEAAFVAYARIQGRLIQLGEYPGLVPSGDPARWVRGEVYALDNPSETLSRLDDYEGCGPNDPKPHEFERVAKDVMLDCGVSDKAWVYIFRGSAANKREILSGDYSKETL